MPGFDPDFECLKCTGQRQSARTPYTANFTRAGVEFTLASVHIFRGLSRSEVSWRISDHYPLWYEFLIK